MQEEVAQFILQYLENRTSLRLAVVLVDIRRTPQESDQQTLQVYCSLSTSIEKRVRFYYSDMPHLVVGRSGHPCDCGGDQGGQD